MCVGAQEFLFLHGYHISWYENVDIWEISDTIDVRAGALTLQMVKDELGIP